MDRKFEILIIDDDVGLALNLQDILEGEGYNTVVGHDGQAALALCREKAFDLAFVDIKLPDIQGVELIDKLAGVSSKTEYIIITGHATLETAIEAVGNWNVVAYQTKPLDMDHLLTLTRQLVGRKRAEEGMERSAREWRTTFDAISDSVCLLDLKGTILRCNKAMRDMIGKPFQEIVGRSCREIVCGGSEPIEGCPLVRIRSTCRREDVVFRKNDRWFNVIVDPVEGEDGDLIGVVHVMYDITENKRMEQERIQLEKMTSLGTMAAGIAHELNNPMMGMLGFVEYCIKHTTKEDRRYIVLKDTIHEIKRCTDIVGNLLTFSRVEKGKEEYEKQSFTTIFDRVLRLLSYRITKENVSITQQIAEEASEIWMKTGNIQQVFLNLITNALDVLEESENKEIHVDVRPVGEFAQVTVSDTGCGIHPEHLQKIFDPFFTTKPAGQGTGLGLSVSQGIVKAHGGEITCESEVGKGTKFKVLLPMGRD